MDINAVDFDVTKLDLVKMKAHILDCVAALGVVQQEFVHQKLPMVLNEGEQPLSVQAQAVSNNVFTNVAMSLMLTTLTSEGTQQQSGCVQELMRAFPDDSKATDGRGWLPLHWAAATDSTTEADMKVLYASDPLALQRYHQEGTDRNDDMGFTPAHLLCMREMTNRSLFLVQHFSICNQQAFTMSASYPNHRDDPSLYIFSALHAACWDGQPTEELLKHLIQLDSSQIKKTCSENGLTPLGFLCANNNISCRLIHCLLDVDSSAEVVWNGVVRCLRSTDHDCVLKWVELLLKANPEAAKYRNSSDKNLLHIAASSDATPFQLCIDVMQRILALHKDAVREVDKDGRFPVHTAARHSTVEVVEFLLGLYPESASVVTSDDEIDNLLHLAVNDTENTTSVMEAKVRLLCSRYPAMIHQRDDEGDTPLLGAICRENIPAMQILCEIGGEEQVRVPVTHPTDTNCKWNGWLPLHYIINWNVEALCGSLLSKEADYLRLFLRWYPEAAGIEGGIGARYKMTPYQLAVDMSLPPYYLRLLLCAAPNLNPAELHRLNYAERRMAMFLAFRARTFATEPPFLARLRFAKIDLVKHVISFL